jgi:hypothetical protein
MGYSCVDLNCTLVLGGTYATLLECTANCGSGGGGDEE